MTGSVNRQYEAIIVSQLDTKVRKTMNLPEMFTSLSTPRLDFIVISYIHIYRQICNLLQNYNQSKESKFDLYWVYTRTSEPCLPILSISPLYSAQ